MSKVPTWSWLLIAAITWQMTLGKEEARVVCYYTNWSVYRPGTAKFNPQNINPYLCTHLVYAFGGFTKENTFKPFDKYQDIEKGGYAKFTGLKTYNKNLKTMLAIGGWNEGSSRFSPLVASPERRKEFVKNSIKFLRQNHFDGLDLDWEYPSFRDGGKPRDKDNYATLVQELREEYERESEKTGRPRLLLTMAVPAGIEYINKGYDVPRLMKYLDWMNILSYDYHSAFEPSVNHHSPLYSLEEASEYNYDSDLNINHTIEHYLQAGAESNKLVLGIPTYGRSYTLFNPEASQIGDPADGPGEMGDATRENGYLAYYEICEKIKEGGWKVENPNPNAMGPYAYKENQWVGYDDEDIVKKKSEFVVERNLGGIMFWSIDNDDFRGNCHDKPYPLIEAAKEALLASMNKIDTYKPKTRNRPNRKEEETIENARPIRKRPRPKVQREEETAPKRKIKVVKTTTTTTTTTTPKTVTTPKYHTPEPPTTPDPGGDFKCEDEGFFPHPRDCKKYFWCLSSGPSELGIVAHQFTCPSGLFFNKAADSCDYTQNVRCVKPKSTTTTSTSTTTSTTTTTTSAPYVSTRRVPPKITASTSRTTTTAPPDDYEYEYEDDITDSEEDPKVLKELINLIKKAGGIEELEKQLKLQEVTSSGVTTPSVFSKTLYERVLKSTKGTDSVANVRGSNSRGPQFSPPENETRSRGRPQYTAINRQRPTTEKEEESVEERGRKKSSNVPEYISIVRQRSSTPAVVPGEVSNVPEYISIVRQRSSTTEVVPNEVPEYVSIVKERSSTTEVPDYVSIVREGSSTTVVVPDEVTEKSVTPEYVTIKRNRPTTEPTKYEDALEQLNAVEQNVTSFEETAQNVSRRYTEPSTTTTEKVSDPITPKNILRPRPFQSETIYTNRFRSTTARTTEATVIEESVRENRLNRRRGYSRFELPESYDQALPETKYQDRKFRPDIAVEIADLSSLTSVDIAKPNGNGRRRIVSRPRVTEAPRRTTTTQAPISESTSTSSNPIRNLIANRKPIRKLSVSTASTTTPSTSTETSTRLVRVFKRYRPTSTSTTTTTTTTTTTVAPIETTTESLSVTEKINLITDDDPFRTPEEEEENIKLSESNILEKSEVNFNSLNNDGIEQQKNFGKPGKVSHIDKATENPSLFYRTRKIIRKLTSSTEPSTSGRTRKIIRKKIGLTSTIPTVIDLFDEVPVFTELVGETGAPALNDVVTEPEVKETEAPAFTTPNVQNLFKDDKLPVFTESETEAPAFTTPNVLNLFDDHKLPVSTESETKAPAFTTPNVLNLFETEAPAFTTLNLFGETEAPALELTSRGKIRTIYRKKATTPKVFTESSQEVGETEAPVSRGKIRTIYRKKATTPLFSEPEIEAPVSEPTSRGKIRTVYRKKVGLVSTTPKVLVGEAPVLELAPKDKIKTIYRKRTGSVFTAPKEVSEVEETEVPQKVESVFTTPKVQDDILSKVEETEAPALKDDFTTANVPNLFENVEFETVPKVVDRFEEVAVEETDIPLTTAEDAATTTEADLEEVTTASISSTESTPAEKITPFYYRAKLSRPPFVLQRTKAVTDPSTSTTQTRLINRKRFERKRPSPTSTTTEKVVTTTPAALEPEDDLIQTTVEEQTVGTTVSREEESTERTHTTDAETMTTVLEPTSTEESTSKLTVPTARKIDDISKSPNSLYKNNRTKNFKNKFINRNYKTTTEPTTIEQVTLLHIFAETDNLQTTPYPLNDKIEKLIEVNRIVEVSLKEGKMKSNTVVENEVTLVPVLDRIGAISRITNIKVVDPVNETETIAKITPKPDFNTETSTIALEGLFRFKNDDDEVLETEHARYVNVKILHQDDASKPARLHKHGSTIPLRILPQDDDDTTSRAEVVEVTPKYNSGLIRIAPIAITLEKMSQRNNV